MEFLAKTDNQSVHEFIGELQTDCLELHLLAKHEVESVMPNSKLLPMLLEFSEEPQYKLLNLLGFYNAVNPQRREEILLKIMGLVEECRSLAKKIQAQSPNDRLIRATAEWSYMTGSSAKEIVEDLIKAGHLEIYKNNDADKPMFETHMTRIKRYIKGFPSFKRIEEMTKQGYFDNELNEEDIAQQDDMMRSIIARRDSETH